MNVTECLAKNFPGFDYTNISQHADTLTQYPHLTFDLGSDLKSCSVERLDQAYFRSLDLIKQIFNSEEESLYLIINDYGPNPLFTYTPTEYLYTLITDFKTRNQEEIFFKDDDGQKQKFLQNVYQLQWNQIDYKKILEGIANLEQGRNPGISQTVFFINAQADIIFYMYYDRGCLIVSSDVSKIRKIYQQRNDWIVEYHRREVEKFFRSTS